jgi:hypothetical protein
MSRGQLARTRANFPAMKDRAFARREGPVVSWGGGMICPCGYRMTWGSVRRAEYEQIEQIIAAHDYCDDDENGGDWICEHTRPELAPLFADTEGRALVEGIHERKAGRLVVGIDPGAPESVIVFDRATGKIFD